nr:oligosaccharide flippase family protein [uncultured Draconibacterium sp.]
MKKYINSISAFQFFQLIRYSTLILVGIVFTKTALTQKAIGEYETFVFLASAVSFFWLNGLLKALLPIGMSRDSSKTNVFSALVVIQSFSLLAALLLLVFQTFFSSTLLNGKPVPELVLLVVFVVVSPASNLVEYYYLLKKRNKAIVIYALVSFSVQFVFVVLPVLIKNDIQLAMRGLVLSCGLRYLWLLITLIGNREIIFSVSFIREHIKLGLPLVVATLLSGSAQFVDGFIVTSKFDEATFAIFRYGARELPLAMLLANALSNAMLPAFAKKELLTENLGQLKQSVQKLMHFLFPLTAILLVVSKPLFPVIFNAGFQESATIFNIYLLLIISRLMLPQTILNGLKISKPIMAASFLELIINVVLSLIFVQIWGIAGIAFATFVAYLFEKIYLAAVVKQRLNIGITDYLPTRIFLIYSAGIVVIFIFAELIF